MKKFFIKTSPLNFVYIYLEFCGYMYLICHTCLLLEDTFFKKKIMFILHLNSFKTIETKLLKTYIIFISPTMETTTTTNKKLDSAIKVSNQKKKTFLF